MTAKEYLSQARQIDVRINSKMEQVSSLRDMATKATQTLTDMLLLVSRYCPDETEKHTSENIPTGRRTAGNFYTNFSREKGYCL